MMEVTSCGELERQIPEGEAGHPLGDLCAKLRHWPKPGSPGKQVKPTWLHSSSQNIATTMWFGEWLDCGLCVVQDHVRQRSVREKPSPSWHTQTHTHTYTCTHTNVNTHTCTLTHSTHTYKYLCPVSRRHTTQSIKYTISEDLLTPSNIHACTHARTHTHAHTQTL